MLVVCSFYSNKNRVEVTGRPAKGQKAVDQLTTDPSIMSLQNCWSSAAIKPGSIGTSRTCGFRRGFDLRALQADPESQNRRLWRISRVTAWRVVKGAMLEAGVVGRPACPRGLRHGFGVGTLQACVPLNMVQKWMGHSRISTTAIYADASGDEEATLAARFWNDF